MAVLIPERGPFDGQVYLINRTPYLLGRSPDCDLLDVFSHDSRVSRQHAHLVKMLDDVYVEDLGSVNGTFVNGQKIGTMIRLRDGDVLSICGIDLRFHCKAQSEETRPTSSGRRSSVSAKVTLADAEPRILSTIQLSTSPADIGKLITSNAEKKLEALIQLLGRLGKSLDIDTMLDDLIKSLFDVFPHAERGFVVLAEEGQRQYLPHLIRYRDELHTTEMRISRTIIDRVSRSKEAILSVDASSDERFAMSRSLSGGGIYSVMCAPLLDSFGSTLGVIQLDSTDRKQFDQQDLDLLASIAPQATMALSHARIHAKELERQAIERDLELARKIQLDLLPDQPPQVEGYEFYSYYKAAYQVGGDYYDYVRLPSDRLAVIIADVCGKGISAALLMAKLSGELKYLLANQPTYASAMAQLNESVVASGSSGTFVTLLLVVIDLRAHGATIVNAGHLAPVLLRPDGRVEEVGTDCRQSALGIFPGQTYETTETSIAAGDMLILFTDGVTEATNSADELYGRQRLLARVQRGASNATELGEGILADVQKFTEGSPQSDDICLLCFRRL